MKTRQSLSQYLDPLTESDTKKIEAFTYPWQRNFLYRFYKQLQKNELKKTDISRRVNKSTDKYNLLPDDYVLLENTLTQFTNFNSSKMTTVSVSNLIAIANALDVSVDYLLGIDKCENRENTDINKATGLNNETIEIIKNNKRLQEKLNFFLSLRRLDDISTELDKMCLMSYISHCTFNAYSKPLLAKLEAAYLRMNAGTFPLDRTIEKYMYYLNEEISIKSISGNDDKQNSIMQYFVDNLSPDFFNQVQIQIEAKNISDEKDIYTIFIEDTARHIYDFLEYKHNNREVTMNKIAQSLLSLLNDYIQDQTNEYKLNFNNYAKKATD